MKKNTDRKTYVLDTNILINSPFSLFSFDEHEVVITDTTIEELDKLKSRSDEVAVNAREANRLIESLRSRGSLTKGIHLKKSNGYIKCVLSSIETTGLLPDGWDAKKPDNCILKTCLKLKKDGNPNVILVSNDKNMLIKADMLGIKAESYRTERVQAVDEQYKGRRTIEVSSAAINQLYQTRKVHPAKLYGKRKFTPLTINEFVTLRDRTHNSGALGIYDGQFIVPLKHSGEMPYDVIPRNSGQRFIMEALLAPAEEIPLVIIKGSAGTAKTFMALACGLEKVIQQGEYERILVARPNVKFDDDIGFLKGTEEDKIGPLIRPIMDNLELLCHIKEKSHKTKEDNYVQYLFQKNLITAQAMAYMRGRSISNTFIILDEFQNSSPNQAFGIISRAGEGSKVVLVGDPEQIDNPRLDSRTNGLVFASERMKGSPYCAQITMEASECVRSALAVEAIDRLQPKGLSK